jgi:cell fate (sporulation/competence/biofilm development) regulator YlbF (YheA/YmcA/DUF963 family)
MEDILQKANELGMMLKNSDINAHYEKLSEELEADKDSKSLLDEYLDLFEQMHRKETSGGVIEIAEKEKLAEIQKKVSENQLIVDYIDAKNSYVNVLMEIQKAVSGGDLSV